MTALIPNDHNSQAIVSSLPSLPSIIKNAGQPTVTAWKDF